MDEQTKHYQAKLDYEIDPSDLKQALDRGEKIVVIDTRQPASYAQRHIPGAINFPHGKMSAETISHLDISHAFDSIPAKRQWSLTPKLGKKRTRLMEL